MTDRAYDLVLFGATGFTGRLVAEHLAGSTRGALRWALAGRNEAKLTAVRNGLVRIDPSLAELPLLVADASDANALSVVALSAKVVCTTVGPYARYGAPLVAACVEAGTDYCDLTGEVQFVRAMIDAHHARAQQTGARIVHCCGYDSIPSDLGVLALHEHVKSEGETLGEAKLVTGATKGGFSGGTAHSMLEMMKQASHDRGLRRLLADPYALSPDRDRDRGPDRGDLVTLRFDPQINQWTAPFVMAACNTRVVRRSNALLGHAYGNDFRYSEVTGLPRGPRGLAMGAALVAGMGAVLGLGASDTTRPWLERVLPSPGEGPSEAARRAGYFKMKVFGMLKGESKPAYVCRIEGDGDPGYAASSRMLATAALQLVETSQGEKSGGVLTPAVALGMPLLDRLRPVGVRFDVTTV